MHKSREKERARAKKKRKSLKKLIDCPEENTAIKRIGPIDSKPREIYGRGPKLFHIGNGGAGATGLLKALCEAYLATLPTPHSIAWLMNHSRNTQLSLVWGSVTIALTYEQDMADIAEEEGWSETFGEVFHDHFCLVGPIRDPAGIADEKELSDALWKIMHSRSVWHSRDDGSATWVKEQSLWKAAGLAPWDEDDDAEWYKCRPAGPAEALVNADVAGAYLLTDRSTLLSQVIRGNVKDVTVFFEPASEGDVLMNSCLALTWPVEGTNSYRLDENSDEIRFLEWLKDGEGQRIVREFGVKKCGMPLFASLEEGFARKGLKGGRPRDGRWVGAGED